MKDASLKASPSVKGVVIGKRLFSRVVKTRSSKLADNCLLYTSLPEGTERVMPGDNVEITVELIYPVALNVGLRFAIREGRRTIGSGQITVILD